MTEITTCVPLNCL